MKVAVAWWAPNLAAGGRAQAIRGNTRGFLEAGHDVDLYWRRDVNALQENADRYDVIVIPFFDVQLDVDTHVHLQVGGYDDPDADADYFRRAFEAADSISVLDPRLAMHFHEVAGLDLDDVVVIPNAANTELFPPQPRDRETGIVFVPKIGGPYKKAEELNVIASGCQDVTFEAHVSGEPPRLLANVIKRASIPLSGMPRRYGDASLVLNPSLREGLPNVAFEAFMSDRVFTATPDGIGLLQTIPMGALDVSDFGASASWFLDEYRGAFHTGEHYVTATPTQLRDVIPAYLNRREDRDVVATAGRDWIEAFAAFSWAGKADVLLDATQSV